MELNNLKISQSFLKAFQAALDPFSDRCQLEVYHKYILKTPHEETKGVALLKGLLFEQILIGSTRDSDNVFEMIPRVGVKDRRPSKSSPKKVKLEYLTSKGKDPDLLHGFTSADLQEVIDKMKPDMTEGDLPQEFKDVRELAREHKGDVVTGEGSIFEKLDILIDQVQPEIEHQEEGVTFIMHPDIGAVLNKKELAWIDIKYTDTKEEDRFNGWGDLENMDHTQAKFYVWLWHLMTGEWIRFNYLIFGKSGWIKWVAMDFDEATMASFEVEVMDAIERLKSWSPQPIGKYNVCRSCPFLEKCDKAQRIPEEEVVSI